MKNKKLIKVMAVMTGTLLLFIQSLFAQNIGVTGTVKAENGEPIVGVSILVKGTSNGVVSDLDGKFTLRNVSSNATLVFSCIGFAHAEIPVNSRQQIDVVLKEDQLILEELVVIGYGVQKKSHLTGSIAKVNTAGIDDVPVSRLDQALQGKVAGLNIQNTSSEAGMAPTIRVRGMGSISASASPLIVVDGFPIAGGLELVNSSDVESIEVLKDAASAAIYGSRAAGGVILITTKSGSADKPSYNLKFSTGMKDIYKRVDRYTNQEYIELRKSQKAAYDAYMTSINSSSRLNINNDLAGYAVGEMFGFRDWQDLGLQSARITNVQASVSDGTDKVKYYLSGNYDFDEGIMIKSQYNKLNMRTKVDAKLSKYVQVGVSLSSNYSRRQRPSNSSGGWYNNLIRTGDWMPVYHTKESIEFITSQKPTFAKKVGDYVMGADFSNLKFTLNDGTIITNGVPWNTSDNSPINIADKTRFVEENYSLNTNTYLNINFTKDLVFRTSNGFFINYMNQDYFIKSDGLKPGDLANGTYRNDLLLDFLSENTITYNKSFGKHSFNALAGYTANLTKHRNAAIAGTFGNDYVSTFNAATAITQKDANGNVLTYTDQETIAMESYLARLTYSFDDKYLLSGSWRADGSSKFGPNNRYGYFPSISAGWRVSQEEFMNKVEWVNSLKIRASYGVSGNNNIANYAAYNILSLVNYSLGSGKGNVMPGYINTSITLGNRSLTWEQTNEFNAGIDFSLFKNRFNGSVDYYNSETKSLLLQQDIPAITGFQNYWNNIGKIRNSGVEVELEVYNIRNKNFTWRTNINVAANSNKLLSLGGDQTFNLQLGERNEGYAAIVGQPAIQFYQFKVLGIYKTVAEAQASGISGAAGGTLKVWDNGDKVLNEADRMVVGSPFPDFTWGFTNTMKIYDFDLAIHIQGSQGGEIMNGDINYAESRRYVKPNNYANSWLSDGVQGDGKTPINSGGINWMWTDYVLEDASYAALREVTLGFTLKPALSKKIGLKSLRAYLSGQNLFFLTPKGFRLVNPEARTTPTAAYNSPLVDGYSRGGFPLQRTISFGLNLSL
jgi:TonB-linked SusC/RagA family outer membrane protein